MNKLHKLKLQSKLLFIDISSHLFFTIEARVQKKLNEIIGKVLTIFEFDSNSPQNSRYKNWKILSDENWININIAGKQPGYPSLRDYYYALVNIRRNILPDASEKNGHKLTKSSVNYEFHVYLNLKTKKVIPEDILKFYNFKKDGDFDLDNYFKEYIYSQEGLEMLSEVEDVLKNLS